ncbi:MAG TPA: hypothetical protein VMS77_06455 [Conexivisphaerales archaeon]|nr:hypothetical protein [Conexivisphaerales archaeon]
MPLRVDPLARPREAVKVGRLPPDVYAKLEDRMGVLAESIGKVEKAAGLTYPPYYVEPLLILVRSEAEVGVTGIYYARNVPAAANGRLHLLVEFTAPLILYASKRTVLAVVAHEFTHYLELVRRFSEQPVSSPAASTMFEATYRDMEEAVPPQKVFGRFKSLSSLIDAKFEEGFTDDALNQRTIKNWYERKLPVKVVNPDDNSARIPLDAVLNADFDPMALAKLKEMAD